MKERGVPGGFDKIDAGPASLLPLHHSHALALDISILTKSP